MDNIWNVIVRNLIKSRQKNVDEDTYQDTIECQLQLLGWYEGIESRPLLPIGASRTLIPDIILSKSNHRVLPIEIKKPTNVLNERQISQLSSYMRRLRLCCGLYIGENIQLYYDTPDDDSDAVSVCTIELEENNNLGRKLCQLLLCNSFSLEALESFCREQFRIKNARNNFRKRIREYLSPETISQNITELIRDKFLEEGFDDAVVSFELSKIKFKAFYNDENALATNVDCIGHNTSNVKVQESLNIEKISKKTENRNYKPLGNEYIIRSSNGIDAKAIYRNGQMIVLRGSTFCSEVQSSFRLHSLRKEIIKKSIRLSNGLYRFQDDYTFDSPSGASCFILGFSTNGWVTWKRENGMTLKDCIKE